jgi:fructuronate reductase
MSAPTMPRLSSATLAQISSGVRLPGYDRHQLRPGIVHLGLGAFARGHLAEFTDDALALVPGDWGMTGVSLKRPDQRDRLAPQDGLFTMLECSGDRIKPRVIGCLGQVLVAPENPQAVVAAMAGRQCRIVSLTVTEKGYCHDPATGKLDAGHPDILHDLEHPAMPRSAVGLIVASLARRRTAGLPPFTVLCCDNLPHNGTLLSGLVRDFAGLRDDTLADWIALNGAFPSTMVDRIVPAMTAADITTASAVTGLFDAAPVSHEPFRQWVIEDRFVGGMRPAWDQVGAQIVSAVAPYEHMKLRLLNGAHSALAYLGFLAGHETISDTVADPVFARYLEMLWANEIIPVTSPPPGVSLSAYAAELHARFANTVIRHRTWQIAMDGSQKLPQRLLSTMRERLAGGLPISCLALAVAAWMRFVGGTDEAGRPIDVRDPLAAQLRDTSANAGTDPAQKARAIINIPAVFGTDLPRSDAFVDAVSNAARTLYERGARSAIAAL